MKKKQAWKLAAAAAVLTAVLALGTGCGAEVVSLEAPGNSAVIAYADDGVRQLITSGEDLDKLKAAFEGDYEKVSRCSESKAEYTFYFGDDLNLDLDLDELEACDHFVVIGEKTYAIMGDEVYRFTAFIGLDFLDRFHQNNE